MNLSTGLLLSLPHGARRSEVAAIIDIGSMKAQHTEIKKVLSDTLATIDAGKVPAECEVLAARLGYISNRIASRLHVEDMEVYPALVDSADPEVKKTARQLQTNMSGLAAECDGFFARYEMPKAIAKEPALFGYEARRLFERLRYRIQREESDLYPMLERVDTSTTH